MRKITGKQLLRFGLPALLILGLAVAFAYLLKPSRLWVNDYRISDLESPEHYLLLGGGRASYDRHGDVLTLQDASVTLSHNAAGIFCDGDLTIQLSGTNTISGEDFGILVKGRLRITGQGTLDVWGGSSGICCSENVTVGKDVQLKARGGITGLELRRELQLASFSRISAGSEEAYAVAGADWRGQRFVCVHTPVVLRFAGNGGWAPESITVPWNEPIPAIEDGVREGYYFDGWFLDRGAHEPYDLSGRALEDALLYAGWTKIVYVSFDSWGGSDVPTADLRINTPLTPPEEPQRTDQQFVGWYVDEKLTEPYDFSLPVTEDFTLYAKWEKVCDEVAFGIDVSSWQGKVDWAAVAESGVQFVLLRVGGRYYGSGELYEDDDFPANLKGALAAGLDVGCYFYCQSISEEEAVQEAEFLLAILGDQPLTLPVFVDFEFAYDKNGQHTGRLAQAGLSGEEHAAICLACCRRVEQEGYTAMVYCGKKLLLKDGMGEILEREGYGVWTALYNVQTSYPGKYVFWQYTQSGKVDGIKGSVDLDLRYIVTPGQVNGLRAEMTDGGLLLQWDRVPDVYAYAVWRLSPDGTETRVAEVVGAGTTQWVDTELKAEPGAAYSYTVSAYMVQSKTEYMGEKAEPVTVAFPTEEETETAEGETE